MNPRVHFRKRGTSRNSHPHLSIGPSGHDRPEARECRPRARKGQLGLFVSLPSGRGPGHPGRPGTQTRGASAVPWARTGAAHGRRTAVVYQYRRDATEAGGTWLWVRRRACSGRSGGSPFLSRPTGPARCCCRSAAAPRPSPPGPMNRLCATAVWSSWTRYRLAPCSSPPSRKPPAGHPPKREPAMLFWHVPAPNEALLISGSKSRRQATQFRIVTGHGCFVLPVKQKARVLSLALREAEIVEECITNQGIRPNVRAVAAFKVGDDQASIANAARRFLSEQDRMEILVGRVFAGHLRSIIGGLTVEQIIRERDRVAQEIKDGSHAEMEKLGIVVDAPEIQEIEDSSGHISNLAAPHAAAVASQARIAKAKADMEAAERELEAAAMKAQFERDSSIKRD